MRLRILRLRVRVPSGIMALFFIFFFLCFNKIHIMALVAQWIAHWTSNPEAAGSSPVKSVLGRKIIFRESSL